MGNCNKNNIGCQLRIKRIINDIQTEAKLLIYAKTQQNSDRYNKLDNSEKVSMDDFAITC
jgi:hypothetical protein